MTTEVATALAALEPDWFAEALGAPVTAVEIETVPFSGATTDLARVRLTYAAEGAGPASVIAKITGRDEIRAGMDAAMGLFAREARFYATLAAGVPVRSPRCFHAGDGHDTPLLLEDLGRLRAGDQMEGLALADAERIIDALAALHARFWESGELDQPWLLDPAEAGFAGMVGQLVASGAPGLRAQFADRIPAAALAAVEARAGDWPQFLRRGVEGPKTLVHHDCRLDNIFFDGDEPVFVDWQVAARARGTQDVANLLAQSMDPELLHAHWQDLVRRYHERLGVESYAWEDCVRHYRQNVLFAVGAGMALVGAMAIDDGRGLGEAVVTRALLHAGDIDAFGAI